MLQLYDSVRTLVDDDYPAGTLGVIVDFEEGDAWVELYYPDDADSPVDCVLYSLNELEPE